MPRTALGSRRGPARRVRPSGRNGRPVRPPDAGAKGCRGLRHHLHNRRVRCARQLHAESPKGRSSSSSGRSFANLRERGSHRILNDPEHGCAFQTSARNPVLDQNWYTRRSSIVSGGQQSGGQRCQKHLPMKTTTSRVRTMSTLSSRLLSTAAKGRGHVHAVEQAAGVEEAADRGSGTVHQWRVPGLEPT